MVKNSLLKDFLRRICMERLLLLRDDSFWQSRRRRDIHCSRGYARRTPVCRIFTTEGIGGICNKMVLTLGLDPGPYHTGDNLAGGAVIESLKRLSRDDVSRCHDKGLTDCKKNRTSGLLSFQGYLVQVQGWKILIFKDAHAFSRNLVKMLCR